MRFGVGPETRRVDVRLLAGGPPRNLAAEAAAAVRHDLFDRLNVVAIPCGRCERRADMPSRGALRARLAGRRSAGALSDAALSAGRAAVAGATCARSSTPSSGRRCCRKKAVLEPSDFPAQPDSRPGLSDPGLKPGVAGTGTLRTREAAERQAFTVPADGGWQPPRGGEAARREPPDPVL